MVNQTLQKIKDDFDTVIRYSQGITDPKTDRLFEVWQESKNEIIKAFGGKYIVEYPKRVTFDLGDKEKHERIAQFVSLVENVYGNSELAQFIEHQEDGFFKNLTVEDYTTWAGKSIRKGAKLVKSFKYFVNNDRILTDIQNEASRIIQEDKIEGTLCFSVHPLDFLSLSETTYNWRSCHSLDGEYRAGNLSYMMDKSTFICYLKADQDVELPNFGPEVKWNSKKWRVLMYLSDDWRMMFAGRQYPFSTASGMDFVLKNFIPTIETYCAGKDVEWSDWNPIISKRMKLTNDISINMDTSYVPFGHYLKPLDELVKDADGAKQFNDLLHSSCYQPIFSFKYYVDYFGGKEMYISTHTKFSIGAYTYCLRCGEEECLNGADTMMCEACELNYGSSDNEMFTYCDCCSRRIYADDAYFVGDEHLCPECYDKYFRECEQCGEIQHIDFIHFHELTEQYVCEYCLEELNEEKENFIYG